MGTASGPAAASRHQIAELGVAWTECRYGSDLSTWSEDGVWVAYAAHNSVVVARPSERALHHMLTGHTNRRAVLHLGHQFLHATCSSNGDLQFRYRQSTCAFGDEQGPAVAPPLLTGATLLPPESLLMLQMPLGSAVPAAKAPCVQESGAALAPDLLFVLQRHILPAMCRVTAVAFVPTTQPAAAAVACVKASSAAPSNVSCAETAGGGQQSHSEHEASDSGMFRSSPDPMAASAQQGAQPSQQQQQQQQQQQKQQQQQQRLVSGSSDRTLRLWDVAARRSLKISRRLPSDVMCLAVTR